MLVNFEIANFRSFRTASGINMVPSSERIHPTHVLSGPSPKLPKALRAAVIYGANAAGKSNLVSALRTLQELVVDGVEAGARIDIDRFRLDPTLTNKPASFRITFYVKERLYEYFLAITPERVERETLTWVRPTIEEVLFDRSPDTEGITFGKSLQGKRKKDREFLSFVARGTRPNQPFLTEAVSRNVEMLTPIVEWFRSSLQIIAPDAPYHPLEVEISGDRSFRDFFSDVVHAADTGISDVETHDQPLDTVPDIPATLKDFAREHLTESTVVYAGGNDGRRIALRRSGDEFTATRITTRHQLTCGADGFASFELQEESDGTRRLFDLVPVLYQSVTNTEPRVFVIDEIGRSLHPHLVRMLFKAHLDAGGSQSQILATTHESHLLDLDLFRRDEIWFVEKDEEQATKLYSLHDFQPRYDKDVRRDYLVGRYGAIPFLGDVAKLVSGPAGQ